MAVKEVKEESSEATKRAQAIYQLRGQRLRNRMSSIVGTEVVVGPAVEQPRPVQCVSCGRSYESKVKLAGHRRKSARCWTQCCFALAQAYGWKQPNMPSRRAAKERQVRLERRSNVVSKC